MVALLVRHHVVSELSPYLKISFYVFDMFVFFSHSEVPPVEPKPPSPRSESELLSTSTLST